MTLKRLANGFPCLHQMQHIRNASYASPRRMNLSDFFYIRHSDIDYSFNMMGHLGISNRLKLCKMFKLKLQKPEMLKKK